MNDTTLKQALAGADLGEQLADIHGILAGSVCAGRKLKPDQWCDDLLLYFGESDFGPEVGEIMVSFAESIRSSVADADMGFRLLHLSDDAELALRKSQLSAWCRGFLHGFSSERDFSTSDLSEDVLEMLADYLKIAQISVDSDPNDTEADLVQIEEYVRIGCILISADCWADNERSQVGEIS